MRQEWELQSKFISIVQLRWSICPSAVWRSAGCKVWDVNFSQPSTFGVLVLDRCWITWRLWCVHIAQTMIDVWFSFLLKRYRKIEPLTTVSLRGIPLTWQCSRLEQNANFLSGCLKTIYQFWNLLATIMPVETRQTSSNLIRAYTGVVFISYYCIPWCIKIFSPSHS